ncbi:uncharacterized protein BDV14DRAFT_129094 [Aspergillus stella-maris]|uniref:uncharacterized protein n=1 Tax=Aspergillus stella-maris TaxID=1810926 RepID=UPI003CCD0A7E
MKITPLRASMALLLPGTLAQSTTTSTISTSTSTSAAPTCTASLITTLCDYPSPGPYAVASGGVEYCWEYCNDNPPCSFVIFAAGNPYLGTGNCWVYPGETFDESKGEPSSECGNPYLSVYDKPECTNADGTPTTTSDACATATETPTPVASVCGYPPPEDCNTVGCIASSGAVHCLSECAEADSCSYVVFNPHNPNDSPYHDGTCWVYSSGSFDEADATECDEPEQFVYENACPRPSSSASASPSASATEERTSGNGTSSTTAPGSTALAAEGSSPTEEGAAPVSLSPIAPLIMGAVVLIWSALY